MSGYTTSSDDYDYSPEEENEEEDQDEEESPWLDWRLFRAVHVKTARVCRAGGSPQTVIAAIAVTSPLAWQSGDEGPVLFASRANGGPLVARGALSGAPGLSAADLQGAPPVAEVAAVVADLLRGCILVSHQPSLVLRLLDGHLDRSELEDVVDLSQSYTSFREALRCELNYKDDCLADCAKWPTSRSAVAALQLAFSVRQCDTLRDYLRSLDAFINAEGGGWIRFSALGQHCPLPSYLRESHTYPSAFTSELFWTFETSSDRQSFRLRHLDQDEQHAAPAPAPAPPAPAPATPPPPPPPPPPPSPAAIAAEFEATLVHHLSGAGWLNVGALGVRAPMPRGVGGSLGRFLDARPELFRRAGNYVGLQEEVGAQFDEEEDEDWAEEAEESESESDDGYDAEEAMAEQARMEMARASYTAMFEAMRLITANFAERRRNDLDALPLRQPAPAPPAAPQVEEPPEPPLGPEEAALACCACLERRKVGAFVPCMHRCCCMPCGNRVMANTRLCPLCRAPATLFARIFD